ncbi:ankyrin [Penicillium macrosclerotiorum]|uniref:ankyrin n=1 Tax=Penicillium macrosclerotiorum TaxID=303699 RepID=UPI002548CCAF|nr:ankyrin [Penicillium macrosclerotiorum]KAJ5698725.1 ankyrin [Penicillium macrosclerotiorum]
MRLHPNSLKKHLWTPLFWSAIRGDEDVARLLLDIEGIDVNVTCDGRAPLSIAAEQGFVGVVQLLLEAGADPNTKDYSGRTPLHWAGSPQLTGESRDIFQRNSFMAHALHSEANVYCPLKVYFESDIIGLDAWAEGERLSRNNTESRGLGGIWEPSILRSVNASLWASGENYEAILQLLLQYDFDFGAVDSKGRSVLSWAVTCGYETLVALLLDNGAPLQNLKFPSQAPLTCAAKNGNMRLVELFLNRGAILETHQASEFVESALSGAAEKGHRDIVQLLLLHTSEREPLWKDDGWAPLMRAARAGQIDIVELLLSVHAERWPGQSLGSKVLFEAAKQGQTEAIRLLVEEGAKVNSHSRFHDLMTPLHLAAMNMHVDTVKYILETGQVDVNALDRYGWTALDWARNGQIQAAKYIKDTRIQEILVRHGAILSSLSKSEIHNPPHHFRKTFSECTWSGHLVVPFSFRCDWESITQGKKMRDLAHEIDTDSMGYTADFKEQFKGWSYQRPPTGL